MIIDWTYGAIYQQPSQFGGGVVFNWSGMVAEATAPSDAGVEFTLPENRPHFVLAGQKGHFTLPENRPHFVVPKEE